MAGFDLSFVKSHLFFKPPVPTKKFTGQTIIVTGSNTGMGLEAARHIVRLDAARVILAVRNTEKGEAARKDIEKTTGRHGVIEVWELDQCHYASVQAFARRAAELDRLDVVIQNAGVFLFEHTMSEDNETTITVNVINSMFLVLLLLPKLQETSVQYDKDVVATFTGSFTHAMTQFEERRAEKIFARVADKKLSDMKPGNEERYRVSKIMQHLLALELAARLSASERPGASRVIVSVVNPGWVLTDIMRSASRSFQRMNSTVGKAVARTPDEGGRILVAAAQGGKETHGRYLNNCKPGRASAWSTSSEGLQTQKRLWDELAVTLETVQPSTMECL
ncbi:NAD(P)-binding protein [Thozetella sp. PMI_491]|nr:NAD(P)-binding protein [Thozetella sp. PMI_491]